MARKWWTLIAVCVAAFMLIVDITIVIVALPSIQEDLGASLSSLQWVVDAYALTLASFLPSSARSATGWAVAGSSRSASAFSPSPRCFAAFPPIRPSSTSCVASRASGARRCSRRRWR